MSVNPLTDLLKLSAVDRAELAIALWESLTEAQRDDAFDLTDEQRRDLDRRWEEHRRNPTSAVSWTEVRAKLLA
jgi:putative addiction module component (TIGR02574 family)